MNLFLPNLFRVLVKLTNKIIFIYFNVNILLNL